MVAKVKSIEPDGMTVIVLDGPRKGAEAWLPRNEWSMNLREWDDAYDSLEIDQELDVVELSGENYVRGRIVVSRKHFSNRYVDETWKSQPRVMRIDSVSWNVIRGHIGSVSAVMEKQTYLDFLRDKNARLFLMDHAVLAKGDMLCGIVTNTSGRDGIVELDVAQYLDLREKEIDKGFQNRGSAGDSDSEDTSFSTISKEVVEQISPVLLVENDGACRESIESILSGGGVEVESAESLKDAQEIILRHKRAAINKAEPAFRMAIVDPNLDLANADLSGMPIIENLQSVSECKILMITGEIDHERKLRLWSNLRVHSFLEKPFTTEDLFLAIDEALALESKKLEEWIKIQKEEDEEASQKIREERDREVQIRSRIETPSITMSAALQELVSVKPGTVAHVFRLHPRSFRAQSLANAGGNIKWQSLRGKIGKSPIKDAAFSDVPIFEKVSDGNRSHLWTLEMLNYEAFCGIPIMVSDNNRYTLVAFHAEADAFDEQFRLSAMLCAEKVARFLDHQKLLERTGNEATFAAAGMTFGSLAHELYNHLIAANAQALLVKNLLDKDNPIADPDRNEARERIGRIHSQTKRAIEKAEALRGTRGKMEPISLRHCLRSAAIACGRILPEVVNRPENVMIEPVPEEAEDEWRVKAVPGSLIIILFNLYLNAVQQIDLMRQVRRRGRVWHSLERRKDQKGKFWAFVRIHDTGPGIHPDDWERIFEPGYTTREKGMGLGLYICNHLLRSIHESGRYASLKVTRSVLWDGTTFTLKLPLTD